MYLSGDFLSVWFLILPVDALRGKIFMREIFDY